MREFRTFKPKVTIKPSLEYRYWSAVLESISTCPEFVPSIFGLENWMVQDILCGSYSIEEVWYSLKCYMNFSTYLFRLRNVNNRANVAGCLDVLKIYFRLCSSYFDQNTFRNLSGIVKLANTAVRNTSVERVDSLESMAEALQLFPWAMTTRSLKTPFLIFLSNFFEIIVKHQNIGWQEKSRKGCFPTKPSIAIKTFYFATVLKYFESSEMVTGLLDKLPEK